MGNSATSPGRLSKWGTCFVKITFAIAFVVLFSTFTYAQKISAEEQKLVDYIDAHTGEAIALLEKTVNIESPTENLAGVKQVGAVFKAEFESLGFTARWINMPARDETRRTSAGRKERDQRQTRAAARPPRYGSERRKIPARG